jgi:hypothetical protein
MTEAEAHNFLKKCRRAWLRGGNLSIDQIHQKTQKRCVKIIVLAFLCVCGAAVDAKTKSGLLYDLNFFAGIFCILVFATAGWTLMRLRQVNQVLLKS